MEGILMFLGLNAFLGLSTLGVFALLTWGLLLIVLDFTYSPYSWGNDSDDAGRIWSFVVLVSLIAVGVTMFWGNGTAAFSMIYHNLGHIALYTVYYVIAGLLWMSAKWFLILYDKKSKYEEMRDRFLERVKVDSVSNLSDAQLSEFKSNVGRYTDRPLISEHKGALAYYLWFWPVSILTFALNRPIQYITRIAIKYLGSAFDKLSRKMFQGIAGEMDEVENRLEAASKAKRQAKGSNSGAIETL